MKAILQRIKDDGFRLTRVRATRVKVLFNENRPFHLFGHSQAILSSGVKADRTPVYLNLSTGGTIVLIMLAVFASVFALKGRK
jgi:hypothetical protein